MTLPRVLREMLEDNSLWTLCPVHDLDTVLTAGYGTDTTFSLPYSHLYLRGFKESAFGDQIHELHRLYQRQKDMMMEMVETNNLFFNAGVSSSRASTHWMCSSISTTKTSVFTPEEDAFAKINEAGIDKSGEKALNLELHSCGQVHEVPKDQSPKRMSLESVVQPENVQHLTGLVRFKCMLDLNEPAKIKEHSDYELNPFQTRSERAEPEAQEPPISTKYKAENGIDLNMSPVSNLSSKEEETIIKTIESKHPREFVSASLHGKHRELVQALPSSKNIILFLKRPWPRKKAKRRAKSTNVETVPRSKAKKDSNFGVNEDGNHSLTPASYIPESHHNQDLLEKGSLSSLPEVISVKNWTNTGKRRRSGKAMLKIAETKSKTRGSFLITKEEEQEKSVAAEVVEFDMSLSESARKSSIKTSDCITPLHWFAKIASSGC